MKPLLLTLVVLLAGCNCNRRYLESGLREHEAELAAKRLAREKARRPAPIIPGTESKPVEKVKEPSIIAETYQLGRSSAKLEQEQAELERELGESEGVVYVLHCIERVTKKKVDCDREIARLKRGRPSRAFRKCKREMIKLTPEQVHAVVYDDEDGTWRLWPSEVQR